MGLSLSTEDGHRRVLVIDTEPGIVRVIARCFGAEGYAVEEAADGVTGLVMAVAQSHDVVLLDLDLPGLGGMEVLMRLRSEKPGQPVVVISSTADWKSRQDCLQLGATSLAKPFTLSELLAVVRAQCAR